VIEEIILTLISALVNGVILAVGIYLGYVMGTRKAVRIAIQEIEKYLTNKPEIRLILANLNNNKPPIKKISKMNEEIENVGGEKDG
jgi:hypothetical protein